jgi:hypothetical protein
MGFRKFHGATTFDNVVYYFGTYLTSPNLAERIFRPSWQSPQGWCVFQSKCPEKFEAKLITVDFDAILEVGFHLHNNRLPTHIANRYYIDGYGVYSFHSSNPTRVYSQYNHMILRSMFLN